MHRPNRLLLPFVAAAFLLTHTSANANPAAAEASAERPRIGLVLGGGGARGATHIGVIRELERMRIPIDAIAGTSIGSVVGGLYASGLTAEEMETLAASVDWTDALSDTPRREDLNFRRKEDDSQFPIKLELGLRQGEIEVPMGLIQGHRLELLLRELTMHVAHIRDFDDLAIPFRAVAANLETAEAHVIGDGELALAMRASMSVPGVFAPAKIDGHLLADGGLVDNLPVGVIRDMDVDIIIAVDAEFPLYAPEELDSAVKISEQMLTILIRKDTLRQIETLGERDILIRPDLGTFASTGFGEIMATVEPGAAAVIAAADRLQELALSEADYREYHARRTSRQDPDGTLDFVRIAHDGRLADASLHARVNIQAGDAIDATKIAADADRLYGLGLYEKINYRLVEENGGRGLEFEAQTKSWGSNHLLFGLTLEDDFEGSTAFNIRTRLTAVGINRRGAEWRNDLQLGTQPLVATELYQPVAAGSRWFVAPRLQWGQSNLNAFVMQNEVAKLRISEVEGGVDFGRQLGYASELRLGVYRGAGEAEVKVGDPGLPTDNFDTGGLFAGFRLDTLDDAHFPRHGVQADLRWNGLREGLGADAEYNTFEADIASTWSRGRSSIQVGASYATRTDPAGSLQDLFPLGGFLRLSGLERGAISGPHAALARILYYRRFGDNDGAIFNTPLYLGASVEAGNVWQSRSEISFDSALVNGSVFAGLDTMIGPVYLAAGFAEGGKANYYLFIGAPPR